MTAPTLAPVLSYSPLVLPAPDRAVDLEMRVSAPATGTALPIALLSHGLGHSNHLSSLHGYGPLAHYYAARGFVVVQPTHTDSKTLAGAIEPGTAAAQRHWRTRAEDMSLILDRLDDIEAAVPHLAGRVDRGRVGVVGHSMGGHTAALLLGLRVTDPADGTEPDLADPRIGAGVLLAAPGRGGDAVNAFASERFPFMRSADFSKMAAPALVVIGDRDDPSYISTAGPDWHADPYHLAPGPKSLVTLHGAEHGLGGIAGYDAAETTDEHPGRVAAVGRLTWAYLRSSLYVGDSAWAAAREVLTSGGEPLGRVDAK